jgi:hypothetical protein
MTWHSCENHHSRCDDDCDPGVVFLKLWVQLPTRTSASLSEVHCGYPLRPQSVTAILPLMRPWSLSTASFPSPGHEGVHG